MTNVIRVLLFSAVIPLLAASQADACWLCWKSHHSAHRSATTSAGGGGGASSGGGLTVNTEDAVRPEAELTPSRVSPGAGAAPSAPGGTLPPPNTNGATANNQPAPSETSTKLDKMSAQLDCIEARLSPPDSAAQGTQESAVASLLLERVAGRLLERVLQDFESRLGAVIAPPAPQPPAPQPPAPPPPADAGANDAAAKAAFISLLQDADVKAALKEAVK
jgi:hypothetical protein